MKKVYNKETAQYLGYQKEYPTLLGWLVATIACLVSGLIVSGLFIGLVFLILSFK